MKLPAEVEEPEPFTFLPIEHCDVDEFRVKRGSEFFAMILQASALKRPSEQWAFILDQHQDTLLHVKQVLRAKQDLYLGKAFLKLGSEERFYLFLQAFHDDHKEKKEGGFDLELVKLLC